MKTGAAAVLLSVLLLLFLSPALAGERRTVGGHAACISLAYFDEMMEYIADGDRGAFDALLASKKCIILKKGLRVHVKYVRLGVVKIRKVSTRLNLWTVSEAVR